MDASRRFLLVVVAVAGVALLPETAGARPAPTPRTRRSNLATPAEIGAVGRIDSAFYPATRTRPARSRLALTIKRLPARTAYSLSITYRATPLDAIQEWLLPDAVATNRFGRTKVVWDTRRGGTLPLGGALGDLAGKTLRVEGAQDLLVLFGPFPKAP